MLITWKQVRNTWVVAQDGAPFGRVRDVVVNSHTGEIPALWVQTPEGMKLLAVSEIQRWTRNEIFIDSPTGLIFPEEFPRLKDVLKQEIQIIKAPVFQKSKTQIKIGECQNFSFDTLSPKLLSIQVITGMLLWKRSKIIHRRQIIDIKIDGIFVSAPIVTEKAKKTTSAKILQNSIPEPEISESFRRE